LAVGIWVSIDGSSFLKIFGPLSSSAMQFVNVGYFLIAAGAVLFVLGFLGCYGAHSENKCALMMVCQTLLHRPITKGPLTLTEVPGDPQTLFLAPGVSP
jgi:tetraspanin-1